ncbi:MAG: hypothetical protein ACK4GT_04895 [Pararhodobacter sp.]
MTQKFTGPGNFHPAIAFWSQIWQAQIEQSLRFWALWAQFVPKPSAAAIAAEAEAPKPVVRTTPARPIAKAAPSDAAKAPAKPLMSIVPDSDPPKTVAAKTLAPKTLSDVAAPLTPAISAPSAAEPVTPKTVTAKTVTPKTVAPKTAASNPEPRGPVGAKAKAGSEDPAKPVIIH